ncbi:MAG: chemotaxis protein CheA, partial [Kordiimonadaceae bacterium]|nr:chemotaxis protein CheA [Kordiimonadaceae bacterium]
KFENLLDELREGRLEVTEGLIQILFQGFDIVSDLVGFAQRGEVPDAKFGQDVLKEIEGTLLKPATAAPKTSEADAEAAPDPIDEAVQDAAYGAHMHHFRIEFTPKEAMYRHANEPLLIIRELRELGTIETTIDVSRVPCLATIEPEDAYFSWVFDLQTEQSRDEIDEVFEFVIDDCDLTIVTLNAQDEVVSVDVSPGHETGTDSDFGFFVDEDDMKKGITSSVAEHQEPVSNKQTDAQGAAAGDAKSDAASSASSASSAAGATASGAGGAGGKGSPPSAPPPSAPPPSAPPPSAPPPGIPTTSAPKTTSIRVDVERVDKLVNMVGELVITQSMLAQEVESSEVALTSRVGSGMAELSMHIRELQENVMSIRMQPVKSVFSRMPRIVRDVSKKLGKKVKLVTIGENTEVDKTVIEELADPLTHMIRNSLDHGLEPPEERLKAGKPEEGEIRLSAEHRGGRIIIQIVDDGRGINREKVYSLAKEKGVIAQDAVLTDDEIDNLIFAPGFSTADEVTDLSGRGVGMDVVRRNIQSLGGRVSVHSNPGKGTTFRLTLPLTLAVLDGMIVGVAGGKYVVPINNIIETVRPTEAEVSSLVDGSQLVHIRGEYIRIVPVARIFGLEGGEQDPAKGLVILVEADGGKVVGLLVDELAGQQQVVIKSLEANYRAVAGVSSATILGNGSVCLILDIDRLAIMDVPDAISKNKLSLVAGNAPPSEEDAKTSADSQGTGLPGVPKRKPKAPIEERETVTA